MNNILMKMLSFLILCSLCIACENKDEYEGQTTRNTDFTVNTGYVKLSEDSAKIAGVLHITANVPTVKLRWNVLPECNIDTTVTSLALMDGIGVLPIKWNRQLANGKYNIQERMFDVGVELIAGEESKYVHLVWADGIDSTVLAKTPVTTRATEASTEETILLNVSPATISMDPVVGGVTKVDFSGIDMIIVDQSRVETITNIDKAAIPLIMEKPGPLIFKWNTLGPPTKDFIATVTLYAGEVYKDLYIKYTIKPDDPTYWEYLYCIPEQNTHIPAKNASVRVYVKTNAQWGLNSLQSSFPIEENATSLGTKHLVIDIDDNPGPDIREVKVNVNSEGTQKEVLTFIQEAPDATFQVISVTPEDNTLLSSDAATVTVKVRTDHNWWIQYGGKKYTFESAELGEKTGTITIPANVGEEVKNHSVIIGYGDKVAQIVNYYQEGKTPGSGTEFTFISADPANNASIPAEESTVTVKVRTDYEWWIEFNGTKTTFPASTLDEKTGTITIPANTSTSDKKISYTVGYGNTTVKTISYTQSYVGADQTLNYVSSNLPTGNIPATATVYVFNFEGGYSGQLRVRSVDATTGVVLFNGPIGTTHSPKVTVPANTSTDTRNIKFQYRLIDIPNSLWLDLPTSTNRIQDVQTSSVTVIPGPLTPDRVLWEYGEDCSCEFTGDFIGDIIMRAMVGNVELARATGKINERISVSIPQLSGLNRIIKFEYSIDKGNTWTNLGNRTQINEYVSFVDLQPYGKSMPANGQTYTWGVGGTYSKNITFQVSVDNTDEGNQIYEESAVPSHTFSYTIPKNPKKQARLVIFRFKLEDDVKWTIIDTKYQDASK
ncbi:hypothetical protein [uncultured Bacteroides sp.]|uniref:hypothetical protein n=1 Tax=uncultured Bacteroides sp. TaxID=162156 RepID=UPI0025D1FE74|nr:hypothetical protein [uncultured Bacteroides sp.]